MTFSRRGFLSGVVAAPLLTSTARGQDMAVDVNDPFAHFRSPENDPEFGKETEIGTGTPYKSEIEMGTRLLFGLPPGTQALGTGPTDHMAIAKYYEAITDTNTDGEKFNAEWSVKGPDGNARANPLITGFFGSTHTRPALIAENGDQLSWCAAFLNLCLILSGKKGTWSAMSGSFRNGPYEETRTPRYGDIVVFRNAGESGDKGHGHVAFFIEGDGQDVTILGGNQVGGTGTTGAVCTVRRKLDVGSQYLHSYRRVP